MPVPGCAERDLDKLPLSSSKHLDVNNIHNFFKMNCFSQNENISFCILFSSLVEDSVDELCTMIILYEAQSLEI